MKRSVYFAVILLLLGWRCVLGQTPYMGFFPGKATRADVERVLGRPVKALSETLIEYASKSADQKVYIQFDAGTRIAQRIELVFLTPARRGDLGRPGPCHGGQADHPRPLPRQLPRHGR